MSDTLAKLITAAQMLESRAADRRRLLQEVKDATEQATLDGCGVLVVYPTHGPAYARADQFVKPGQCVVIRGDALSATLTRHTETQ